MIDETELARKQRIVELNTGLTENKDAARTELEIQYGEVWDSDQLREQFTVHGFMAPFVVATRKSTGQKGSLEFTHSPRFYFNWQENR